MSGVPHESIASLGNGHHFCIITTVLLLPTVEQTTTATVEQTTTATQLDREAASTLKRTNETDPAEKVAGAGVRAAITTNSTQHTALSSREGSVDMATNAKVCTGKATTQITIATTALITTKHNETPETLNNIAQHRLKNHRQRLRQQQPLITT